MRGARVRTSIETAVAAVTAAALALVCEPGDPFRGTLGLLPLVVAGLRALERHSGARVLRRAEGRIAAFARSW